MGKKICFFHSADLDGHCSGAIVKTAYPNVELIGVNYGDDFPWDKIDLETTVYMVDFSLQPFDLMIKLFKGCKKFIWIDHHKSAIEEYKQYPNELHNHIYGIRDTGRAACELCWNYLFPEQNVPESVKLLSLYDIWDISDKKNWENNILPFQFGMQLEDTNPINSMNTWYEALMETSNGYIDGAIYDGNIVLKYQRQYNKKYISSYGYKGQFEGYDAIIVNKGMTNSQLFESVPQCDLMIAYCRHKSGQWTVSLYSTTVDVSEIAKKYGGGGHKGASGFQCNELPFNKTK